MSGSRNVEFQWAIWTIFALENWILDFGRPIAMVCLYNFNKQKFQKYLYRFQIIF